VMFPWLFLVDLSEDRGSIGKCYGLPAEQAGSWKCYLS
jgi:hypothetical protein